MTSPLSTFEMTPEDQLAPSIYAKLGIEGALKQANTPIFTPIPFLHEDARRRSRSRSRSKSPGAHGSGNANPEGSSALLVADGSANAGMEQETQGLGLVDELDSPAPGHIAAHPTALSATTTAGGDVETLRPEDVELKATIEGVHAGVATSASTPSLGERFTTAREASPPPSESEGGMTDIESDAEPDKDGDKKKEDAEVENMVLEDEDKENQQAKS